MLDAKVLRSAFTVEGRILGFSRNRERRSVARGLDYAAEEDGVESKPACQTLAWGRESGRVSLLNLHAVRREEAFVVMEVLEGVPRVGAYYEGNGLVGVIFEACVAVRLLTCVDVAINFASHFRKIMKENREKRRI